MKKKEKEKERRRRIEIWVVKQAMVESEDEKLVVVVEEAEKQPLTTAWRSQSSAMEVLKYKLCV